ncbi:hypothetical protein ACFSUK_29815 [Sphingobium scionense]
MEHHDRQIALPLRNLIKGIEMVAMQALALRRRRIIDVLPRRFEDGSAGGETALFGNDQRRLFWLGAQNRR